MLAKFVHSKGTDRAEDTGRAENEKDIEVTKKAKGVRDT